MTDNLFGGGGVPLRRKLAYRQVYVKDGMLISRVTHCNEPKTVSRPFTPYKRYCIDNGIDTQTSAWHTRRRKKRLLISISDFYLLMA